MDRINVKDLKYYEPIHKVKDIMKDAKGVNYIIIMADAHDRNTTDKFPGGQMVHFEADENGYMTSPTDMELIGNTIQAILEESGMRYIEKVKWVNTLYENLMMNIAGGKDTTQFEPVKGEE